MSHTFHKEREARKTGAKRISRSCGNHGSCPWCAAGREHKNRKAWTVEMELRLMEEEKKAQRELMHEAALIEDELRELIALEEDQDSSRDLDGGEAHEARLRELKDMLEYHNHVGFFQHWRDS